MKTNNIIHRISVNNENVNCKVEIRLNDECKNGHEDFSITGTFWEIGKLRTDRYMIGCGCMHENILEYFPELKPFVDLHLSDYKGMPMHAIGNMQYHLEKGFNRTANTVQNREEFKAKYCEYYRLTGEQFDKIEKSVCSEQLFLLLTDLKVFKQWKKQADSAIKILEKLTGLEFESTSTRSHAGIPTEEQIKAYRAREKEGYYTLAAEYARRDAKQLEYINRQKEAIEAKRRNELKELSIKLLIKQGFEAMNREGKTKLGFNFDNFICYSQPNRLVFNWQSWGDSAQREEIVELLTSISESLKELNIESVSIEKSGENLLK